MENHYFLTAEPTDVSIILPKQTPHYTSMSWSTLTDNVSHCGYGKWSNIPNTFLSLFSNKMLVIRARINKTLDRIANMEDLDQTASSEAV